MSSSRVLSKARPIASLVISWNTIRLTGTLGESSCSRCQLMLSPSRSSSVASSSWSAPLRASLSSLTTFLLSLGTTYSGSKAWAVLTPRLAHFSPLWLAGISLALLGKSRTWPMEASTRKSFGR